MEKSKIIVCTHKKDFVMQDKVYSPIHVGKAGTQIDLGIQGDHTADNISTKNPHFCELTGLYWAWKNIKDQDYYGLAHYRRYFDLANKSQVHYMLQYTPEKTTEALNGVDPVEALGNADIILPVAWRMPISVGQQYVNSHVLEDYAIMVQVLLNFDPEYEKTIVRYFSKDNRWIAYNMFFTNKEIFNDYCSWLFQILFEVEKYVQLSDYPFQKRVFGFMGEILLPLYCIHNELNIKSRPVLMVGDVDHVPSKSKIILQNLKSQITHKINKPLTKKELFDPNMVNFLKSLGLK